LTWFVFPGFGLIDLSVTWDPEWPQVLEAGWGLYMTLLVGVPFTVVAIRGHAYLQPAGAQLSIAGVALIVSAAVAMEWQLLLWALAIALETVIMAGLPPSRRPAVPASPINPLLVAAALGTIPWIAYAIAMWNLNRQNRVDGDITVGTDHYSVQGAFALALLGLVTAAALWPTGRLLMGTCAGLAAVYLGIVSWTWHPTAGSFDQPWSILCALWGLLVVVLTLMTRSRRSTG
jgi:hypothetical protein